MSSFEQRKWTDMSTAEVEGHSLRPVSSGMTVGKLIELLKQQPPERRVMVYDFERHDEWLDVRLRVTEVAPVVGHPRAKYGTGEVIVSVETR